MVLESKTTAVGSQETDENTNMSSANSVFKTCFPRISAAHIEGAARPVRHRQQQFHRLHSALVSSKTQLVEALKTDNGYTESEAIFEYSLTLSDLRNTYETVHLKEELIPLRSIERGRGNFHRIHGLGIVYIKTEKSKSSLYSVLCPLHAAMAAGNCVVVEMPQTTQNLISCLRSLLPEALDQDTFAISESLPPPGFLKHCVLVDQCDTDTDKINSVKQLVSSPCSATSFAFVDRTADIRVAARCILEAKFAFNGRSSYAPDMVFVHEAVQTEFTTYLLDLAKALPAFSHVRTENAKAEQKEDFLALREEKSDVHVLLAGRKGRVVLVKKCSYNSTTQPRMQNRSSAPPVARLALYSTTSIDDMIDSATEYTGYSVDSPAAALIFASLSESSYLANAINADITCVNNFPAEICLGPRFPRSMKNSQDPRILSRYTREMFEERHLTVLSPTTVSETVGSGIPLEAAGTRKEFHDWSESVALPLKSTGQGSGKHGDFFLSALFIGAIAVAVPLVGSLILMGRFALKGYPSILNLQWR